MGTGYTYMVPLGFNFIKWISNHLLKPIIDVMVKILDPIFSAFLNLLGDLISNLLAGVFYMIYTTLLAAVDFSQTIFDFLSGSRRVYSPQGGFVLQDYLLSFFINYGPVKKAFLGIFAVSLALCTVFTFIACAKAAGNYSNSGKKAVDVIRDLGKTLLTFVLIQVLVIGTVEISNRVLTVIDQTIQMSANSTVDDVRIANVVFVSTTLEAAKNGAVAEANPLAKAPWSDYYSGRKSYSAPYALGTDFHATKVDYVTGFISCLFLIFVMFSAAFLFIQRLFEVVLLYVMAPFFVASMPLDGGTRFASWREMFIAKCLSSYGIVVSMRLFTIFIPIFMSKITYDGDVTINYLIRLLLILGSCMAIKKSQSLILQIIHPQAAQSSDTAMGSLMAVAMTARAAAGGAGQAFRGKK